MLVKHYSADGATVLTQNTWGPFVSGAAEVQSSRIKFALENVDSRVFGVTPFTSVSLAIQQSGTNDGYLYVYTAADGSGTVSKPFGAGTLGAPTAVIVTSGGSFTPGTYGYKITATNATGETIGSTEVSINVGLATDRVQLNWIQTPGATGYKVYRTTTPGTYGATTLRTTIGSGATITFTDDGSATSSGTPPTTNTTGGAGPAFGTPPAIGSFTQVDKLIASNPTGLRVGEQYFYWAVIKVPALTSDVGNTRVARILPVEA
jgi:hypothetical protein